MLTTPLTALAPQIVPPESADDLDAIDVFQQRVLRLPKNAGKKRRVDAAAIDQDEHRAGKARDKTADADRPTIAINTAHRHAGSQAQSFRNGCYAGPANVFLA